MFFFLKKYVSIHKVMVILLEGKENLELGSSWEAGVVTELCICADVGCRPPVLSGHTLD